MRTKRDYSLLGREGQAAVEKGLGAAQWRRTDVPRKHLKELMQRRDGPAIRDTAVWLSALAVSGGLGYALWGSSWALPCFLVYGILYGSASDSRWHECGHGTAFKTRWMNDAVYQIACFMIFREPTVWRWSHARHHTDTIVVGRDPEIVATRPPDLFAIAVNFFAFKNVSQAIDKLLRHATGRLTSEEKTFIPAMEWGKVYTVARIWLAIHASAICLSIYLGSWLPVIYIGILPTMYGAWFGHFVGLTQHAGLAEDVVDHRLNSRTVYMNPVFRFLYWNMNYHIEHHMFPMVPYHALPKLHEAIRFDCPPAYAGCWEAYKEIIPALLRQSRDPDWYVARKIPPAADSHRPSARADTLTAPAE